MNLRLTLLAGLIGSVTVGSTKAQSTDALLIAPVVKNTVYISRDETKHIRFYGNSRDDEDMNWEHAVLRRDSLFLVKDGTFNLRYMIANPLRYKFIVEGTTIEDKYYYQKVEDIIAEVVKVTALVTRTEISSIIGTGVLSGTTSQTETLRSEGRSGTPFRFVLPKWLNDDVGSTEGVAGKTQTLVTRFRDAELRKDLFMLLGTNSGNTCLNDATSDWLVPLIKADSLATYNPREMTRYIVERGVMLDITNKDAADKINALRDTLAGFKKRNEEYAAQVAQITDKAIKANCVDGISDILYYLFNKKRSSLAELSEHRKELATKLAAMLDELQQVQNKVSSTESLSLQLYSAELSPGQLERVKLTILERKYDLNGSNGIEATEEVVMDRVLLFREHDLIIPRVFPGVIFTDLKYNVFEATLDSTGSTVLKSGSRQESFVKPAVLANFNVDIGRSKTVPFLQIGASASRERPLIGLGVGMQLNEHFAISVGGLFHWQQQLDKLSVGDVVADQDVVDKDIVYRLQDPSLYLSIQLR